MVKRLLLFLRLLPPIGSCYRPFLCLREIPTNELPLELCGPDVETKKCTSPIHFDGG